MYEDILIVLFQHNSFLKYPDPKQNSWYTISIYIRLKVAICVQYYLGVPIILFLIEYPKASGILVSYMAFE